MTFATEIQAAACPCCRPLLRRVLLRYAGRQAHVARREVAAPAELALAAQLLAQMTVAEARAALMVRLPCGRTKAYSLLALALRSRSRGAAQERAEPMEAVHA